jgi:hypothetical protein
MLGKGVEVLMRQRVNKYVNERRYNDFKQAAGLLRHDLVWSEDFEAIRLPLADLIGFYSCEDMRPAAIDEIVHNLIATENDLTI